MNKVFYFRVTNLEITNDPFYKSITLIYYMDYLYLRTLYITNKNGMIYSRLA